MTPTPPRIPPLPAGQWTEAAVDALRVGFGERAVERMLRGGPDGPQVPNVLATLMWHPTLAGPFLAYNAVLLNQPTLAPRLRELLVLRVAWRARSTYEWLQHVRMAPSCGIATDEVTAIGGSIDDGGWAPLEAALLEATDQLLDRYRIDDDTWARLAEHLDERQLIEVLFLVGTYTCLAMAFNSVGLEPDPELSELAAPPFPSAPEGAASP